MKFIGRKKELHQLETLYQKPGFQMVVMYGRRRIGKTTLLNEFVKGKRNIFFMATRTTADSNLQELSSAVMGETAEDVDLRFGRFQDVFHYISSLTGDEKLVVVFDEFPYLCEAVPGITSVLQKVIDQEWNQTNLMLILCGSSIAMMEEEVLSEKSPLYGRRTAQMDIQPFDYLVSSEFVPDYSPEEKAVVYGITGGIPKYLSMLDPKEEIGTNIESLFFDDAGYFFEEPENLLQQEFRNVASYNAVLRAVAEGAVHLSEIAQKTHLDSSLVSQILKRLIRVRVIRKDVPVPFQKNRRYIQYVLNDGMFRFWYRFVAPAVNLVERGSGAAYYQRRVSGLLHEYMGAEFEIISQQFLWKHMDDMPEDLLLTDVGKWRGHDNRKQEPADIDVVGLDHVTKKAVIGECKFRTEQIGRKELLKLQDRARLILPYQVKRFYLFSLSGFQSDLDDVQKDDDINCITLREMYEN